MIDISRLTANKTHPFTAEKQDIIVDNNLVNQLTTLQKKITQQVNSVIENEQKKTTSQNQSGKDIPILTPPADNLLSNADNNAQLLLLMKQYQQLIGKNEIKNLRENLTQWKIQAQLNNQIQQAKKVEQVYLKIEKNLSQYRDDFIDSWLHVAKSYMNKPRLILMHWPICLKIKDSANSLSRLLQEKIDSLTGKR